MELQFFDSINQQLSIKQQEQYHQYYQLIAKYNKVMNLTGIDDEFGVYLKHFYDCLTICQQIDEYQPQQIADVGSGAGFPGIVLAIYYPQIEFTLIEPLTKRIKFLEIVVANLGLNNVTLINERVEDIELRFDLVTSRAVAKLNILLELCAPIANVGGHIICLKGPKIIEELQESGNAIKVLGLQLKENLQLVLPVEQSIRYNIVFEKNSETPTKYPRNFGQIKKKPL